VGLLDVVFAHMLNDIAKQLELRVEGGFRGARRVGTAYVDEARHPGEECHGEKHAKRSPGSALHSLTFSCWGQRCPWGEPAAPQNGVTPRGGCPPDALRAGPEVTAGVEPILSSNGDNPAT